MLEAIGELGWEVFVCFPLYLTGLAELLTQLQTALVLVLYFAVAALCTVVLVRKTRGLAFFARGLGLSFVIALLFGPGIYAMGASYMGPNALFLGMALSEGDIYNAFLNTWLLLVHWFMIAGIWFASSALRVRRGA